MDTTCCYQVAVTETATCWPVSNSPAPGRQSHAICSWLTESPACTLLAADPTETTTNKQHEKCQKNRKPWCVQFNLRQPPKMDMNGPHQIRGMSVPSSQTQGLIKNRKSTIKMKPIKKLKNAT